ncbi:MAG TPA: pilus assembly PilX N-terminal domain-containing protein [Gemmatimonadaceae bacterium]|nr:pilus assembly PilX N-terminal domain-containing protein [Gemmatimonadaceae bacterium]
MHRSRPAQKRGDRRGFALALALMGIVLIATLISGAYFMSQQEFRSGRNQLTEQRAFSAAEYGMGSAVKRFDKVNNLQMAFGAVTTPDTVQAGGGAFAVVRTTRVNEFTYSATSEGYAGGTNAQVAAVRKINEILRIARPSFDVRGALTVNGPVSVQGSSKVNGNDSIPDQWKTSSICPVPGAGLPGVAAPDTGAVTGDTKIFGTPPKVEDPAAADTNTYFKYGDESWNTLTANADIVLPGGNYSTAPTVIGSACNKADVTNWGDTFRTTPCDDYFPIIYIKGSIKLNAGSIGQGILLVEGDLEMTGGFEFVGIAIVRDDIKVRGTGNKVSGAVFAGNQYISDNTSVSGNAEIRYSSCGIDRALKGASTVVRAKQRGWSEIF